MNTLVSGSGLAKRDDCGMTKMKQRLADRMKIKLFGRGPKNVEAAAPENSALKGGADRPDLPAGDAGAEGGRIDWVDETIAGTPNEPKSMTFTFAPGAQPLSPYTIRRGVGIGGFGEVYFAVSEAGKEVALKRIQRNLDIELRGVSQCLNLKHPNLVSLFDICRDADGGAWVVMEYVAGQNLRQILDQQPSGLSEQEAVRWFLGIASGVDHLHGAGLVHRDLKPGNVFDDLGIVKVGDYGLSKYISASQRGGQTESVGTFHYMAPEIGKGNYGREIDIYALGVILFELLTGRVPFDGESLHEIIVKHLTALPDLAGIAEPYRSVISRSMEKDPAKRPSTVEEMIAPLGLRLNEPATIALGAAGSVGVKEPTSPPPAPRVDDPVYFADAIPVGKRVPPQPDPIRGTAQAAPFASPVQAVTSGKEDEPLLRAVKSSWRDFRIWWSSLDHSPKARFWLGALIAFVLFVNTHWLLPVLSMFAVIYVPYYVVRQMVLHSSQKPSYARAQTLASQTVAKPRPRTKQQWRYEVRNSLRNKPLVGRAAELNTSWIASGLTVLVMTVVAGVIGLRNGNFDAADVANYFWSGSVVLFGSACLLALGKFWEPSEGEGLTRRVIQSGIGAGVGLVAFVLLQFFLIPETSLYSEVFDGDLPQTLYHSDGTIRAAGMMAHFALLFGGIRWWKSVDPLRRTRLSFWSTAVVCVAAWILHQFLPVPQPLGLMVAGGLSIATQMSAPWINPRNYVIRSGHYAPGNVNANDPHANDQRVSA